MSENKHTPGPVVKCTLHCEGCPALQTEYWTFIEENDGLDSGTDARCTALTPPKHIASYWSASDRTPDWCPAISKATGTQP